MINIHHDDAVLRTFMLFAQTARSVMKYADVHLYRETDLSAVKLITLKALEVNNGTMRHSEIAEWTQTERNNITTLIDRMKKENLVTTEHSTKDKRVINVHLTDKGKEVLDKSIPAAQAIVDRIMASLTQEEIIKLEELLKTIVENSEGGLEYYANQN